MKELIDLYNAAGHEFLDNLFKSYIVVSEKIAGSSISFEKHNQGHIVFYKGNRETRISKIDRTLMKYYESGINYLEGILESISDNIPVGWVFCFQYFANNNPSIVQYEEMPKNNLVLTHIQIYNNNKLEKILEDPRVIKDWGEMLSVSYSQPIFQGYLDKEQKEKIKDFLDMPKEDHQEIFKTSSLAEFIVKTLNPNLEHTLLQKSLSSPIDSIVFKFYKPGETKTISAKIIDPYTINLLKKRQPITREQLKKAPADINEILLLDVLSYLEQFGYNPNEILSLTPEDRYIELISIIFNSYIYARGNSLSNISIDKAYFAKGDEFNLNIDNIQNSETRSLIEANPEFGDVFKVMLGSFRKKRNPSNIMTPSIIDEFNKKVDEFNEIANRKQEGFKTFYDYLNIFQKETDNDIEEMTIEESIQYNEEFTMF